MSLPLLFLVSCGRRGLHFRLIRPFWSRTCLPQRASESPNVPIHIVKPLLLQGRLSAPLRLQDSPWPHLPPQRRPKGPPRIPQGIPRVPQRRPKGTPQRLRGFHPRPPKRPKGSPRVTKVPQGSPKPLHGPPRAPPSTPKSPQGTPQEPPKPPKAIPRSPKPTKRSQQKEKDPYSHKFA